MAYNTILFDGDSLTSDIQGGINYGLDTCYYNPRKLENLSGIKPTFEINSLAEIFGVLDPLAATGR